MRVNNAYERTLLVSKIKALVKILREVLTNILSNGGETDHSRVMMDWVDKIDQLKELDILDTSEAC